MERTLAHAMPYSQVYVSGDFGRHQADDSCLDCGTKFEYKALKSYSVS